MKMTGRDKLKKLLYRTLCIHLHALIFEDVLAVGKQVHALILEHKMQQHELIIEHGLFYSGIENKVCFIVHQ